MYQSFIQNSISDNKVYTTISHIKMKNKKVTLSSCSPIAKNLKTLEILYQSLKREDEYRVNYNQTTFLNKVQKSKHFCRNSGDF